MRLPELRQDGGASDRRSVHPGYVPGMWLSDDPAKLTCADSLASSYKRRTSDSGVHLLGFRQ